jgi:hypothetical protein
MGKSRFLRRNYGKISFFEPELWENLVFWGGIITTLVNVAEMWEYLIFLGGIMGNYRFLKAEL